MSIGTDGRIGPKGFEELPPEVAAWERAVAETNRLQRELNITNADHIALWLEANTIPDEPMSQCISWLACRIVEAHERAVTAQPVDETEKLSALGDTEWMNLMPREVVARAALSDGCRDKTADDIRAGLHSDVKIKAEVAVKIVGAIQEQFRAALRPQEGEASRG